MSHTIFKTKNLEAVAFCGKNGNASVEVTVRGNAKYGLNQVQLTEKQVVKLAEALMERVKK